MRGIGARRGLMGRMVDTIGDIVVFFSVGAEARRQWRVVVLGEHNGTDCSVESALSNRAVGHSTQITAALRDARQSDRENATRCSPGPS